MNMEAVIDLNAELHEAYKAYRAQHAREPNFMIVPYHYLPALEALQVNLGHVPKEGVSRATFLGCGLLFSPDAAGVTAHLFKNPEVAQDAAANPPAEPAPDGIALKSHYGDRTYRVTPENAAALHDRLADLSDAAASRQGTHVGDAELAKFALATELTDLLYPDRPRGETLIRTRPKPEPQGGGWAAYDEAGQLLSLTRSLGLASPRAHRIARQDEPNFRALLARQGETARCSAWAADLLADVKARRAATPSSAPQRS